MKRVLPILIQKLFDEGVKQSIENVHVKKQGTDFELQACSSM